MNVKEALKKCVTKKRLLCCLAILLVVLFSISLLGFLFRIHFKIGAFLLSGGLVDRYKSFENFEDNKEGLDIFAETVLEFVSNTPDFFEKYSGVCYAVDTGILFSGKGLNNSNYILPLENDILKIIRNSLNSFPDKGYEYGSARIRQDYPYYVIFDSPRLKRNFVYTGGKKPSDLIDEYWNEYEFVWYECLDKGWYDIQPSG